MDEVLAVFGRAEARAFMDLMAIEGQFGLDRLFLVAAEKDPGFDLMVFSEMTDRFDRLRRDEFPLDDQRYGQLTRLGGLWRQQAYPAPLPKDLKLEGTAYRAAGSNRVDGLHRMRVMLAALDHHSAPSPLSIRFGPDDVVEAVVDGVRIALDTADDSASGPMLRDRSYEPEVTRVLRDVI